MITEARPTKSAHCSFKTVQHDRKSNRAELPSAAVLIEHFKTTEQTLQSRGILPNPTEKITNPLWFYAEMERNVYLWQHGFSLADKEQFEFWIDGPRLIAKRLGQLDNYNPDNPFLNPLWGTGRHDGECARLESAYLASLGLVFTKMWKHLHVISLLQALLQREFKPQEQLKTVVLPSSSPLPNSQRLH